MYVACLDCGKELEYDWNTMRVGRAMKPLSAQPREQTEVQQEVQADVQPAFRMANNLLTALIRR
jgi:hypothetical protein